MKRTIPLLALLGTLTNAFGLFPFYDPIADATASGGSSYAAGSALWGQTTAAGDFWHGVSTTANATNPIVVTAIPLFHPGLPSSGNSVRMGAPNSGPGARMFCATDSSGFISINEPATFYYSLLLRVLDLTSLSESGDYFAGFNNQGTVADQTGQAGSQGARLYLRKVMDDGVAKYQIGTAKNSAVVAYDDTLFTTDETVLVVQAYEINAESGTDDNVRLWVNPSSATFGSHMPPEEDAGILGEENDLPTRLSSFVLLNRAATIPTSFLVDEIRVGRTWAFVTGGPEFTTVPEEGIHLNHSAALDLRAQANSGSTPLSYRWQVNGVDLVDGPTIAGATTSNLVISSTTQAGEYAVIVSNTMGTATNITTVTLADPYIAVEPTDQVVAPGGTARFNVEAFGTAPLTYRWQKSGVDLSDGGNISGSGTPDLTLSNVSFEDATYYNCIITNGLGNVVFSAYVNLTLVDPGFASEPQPVTVDYGDTALFSVEAVGTAPLSYRWQKDGVDLANGAASSGAIISGAASDTLSIAGVSHPDAGSYSVTVTNGVGATASSSSAVLTVNDPFISVQPASQTSVVGATAVFSVSANGTPPLSYQWYQDDFPVEDGGGISGATTATLTISPVGLAAGGNYKVTVSGGGGQVESEVAVLQVEVNPGQSLYWDGNGESPGAGEFPGGTWGFDPFWNLNADGQGAPGAWVADATAVFSAGADAIHPFTVTVSETQFLAGLRVEEGPLIGTGTLAVNSGALVFRGGEGQSELFVADDVSTTIGAVIAGTNDIVKVGGGHLRLNGVNTHTGRTIIREGTVSTQADARFGANPVSFVPDNIILDGGTIEVTATGNPGQNLPANRGILITANNGTVAETAANGTGAWTVFSVISGPGKLTKIGGAVLRLENSNTYIGGTDLLEGKIYLNANDCLGTGVLSIGSDPDILLRSSLAGSENMVTITNDIVLTEGANPIIGPGGTGAPNGGANQARLHLSGIISGPGGFTRGVTGNNLLILSGANTFSGGFTITHWPIVLGHKNALGTGAITIGDEFVDPETQHIQFNGLFDMTGENAIPNPLAVYQQFSMAIAINTNSLEFSGPVELINPNIPIYANWEPLTHRLSGVIGSTNGHGFQKYGVGTLVLSAANTYPGGTTIVEGTLLVNNSGGSGTGSGFVTVNAGSALGGSGTIAGRITVQGGTLSPGAGAEMTGQLTLQDGLDLSPGGTVHWELGFFHDDHTAGIEFDRILVTGGTVTLGTSASLSLNFLGVTAPDASQPFWQQPRQWTIIGLAGSATSSGENFATLANADNPAGAFSTTVAPNGSVLLHFTPSGTPPMGPAFTSITAGTGGVTFSWPSENGVSYRVEYKNDLNESEWLTLTTVAGDGTEKSVTDPLSEAQRFYRLVVLTP